MDLYEAMDALYQRYGYHFNGRCQCYQALRAPPAWLDQSGLRKNPLERWATTRLLA